MYVESEHIQSWIEDEKAKLLPTRIARELGAYLESLPWLPSGSGLDWGRIRSGQAALSTLTSLRPQDWLQSTLMANDSLIVFWYAANQPCIVCDAGFAIANIDRAYWKAPGKRYFFGALARDGQIEPIASHFAEFDGAGTVTAAR